MIKLLLVDDDQGVLESVKMVFKGKPGYQLLLAASGREALKIAEQEKPNLVVLDMLMENMSGEEAFRKLKSLNPQVNVIFLTGLEKEKVAEKANALGAKGYLTKPFNVFTLEDYFKKVVPELY